MKLNPARNSRPHPDYGIKQEKIVMIFAAATLNQTPLDWSGNVDRIVRAIQTAKKQQARLLVLPELCITGIGCQSHFRRPSILKQAKDRLFQILPQTDGIGVALGLPWEHAGKIHNAAALLYNRRILAIQCKTELSCSFQPEPYWFSPWNLKQQEILEIDGQSILLGDLPFISFPLAKFAPLPNHSTSEWKIRLEIGDVPKMQTMHTWNDGADAILPDVILHLGGSPFTLGRHVQRLQFFQEISNRCSLVYLFANQLGNEGAALIYDGGAIIAESGTILAQTARFSFNDVQVVVSPTKQSLQSEPVNREEELLHVVSLGLFDYLRKTRTNGFILSLSGGADSAALAVFVFFLVRLGIAELGLEPFWRKITNNPTSQSTPSNERELLGHLLTCVYQASENSSETTYNAAKALAEELGATFHSIDISGIIATYTELLRPLIDRPMDWDRDDHALQNIQARSRGPGIWFLANLKKALLLCAGNRSEETVGYTTIDGDTCGGLSPIGGIDKHYLRSWLRWVETIGPKINGQHHPVLSLHLVNKQVPTAELRPKERAQTDEADLMVYEMLEQIEHYAVYGQHTPAETLEYLLSLYPEENQDTLRHSVARFFSLWTGNQWKQQRYALSFYLDDRCGRPGDCRLYPNIIGQGGLE